MRYKLVKGRRRKASDLDNPVQAAGAARGRDGARPVSTTPAMQPRSGLNCFAVRDGEAVHAPSCAFVLHGVIQIRRLPASGFQPLN
jgi:hypothetical protein